ncbi:competence protein ComEA [Natranaerovirga pectinivora]|uniref:Competence protein ComEA n=1 Tax=Natranaerovirga pectinivora TaxID=682400 RepID=A0A4R3MMZ5_9FIRM|nr:helix-hairpin-helix domain-containing protein [Natranaerovirga pectinivora]TCT16359.1 competence protein ComEA [Natranaerovirga pectinivora]
MKVDKYTKLIGLLSVILIAGIIYILVIYDLEEVEISINEHNNGKIEEITEESEDLIDDKMIYVFLCGAINNPGVYEVVDGTRVFEVMNLAGGLADNADQTVVNQAQPVMDGQQIYFPTIKEVEEGYIEEISVGQYLININTASIEQLITLPGVGEVRAQTIINFRNKNGRFKSTEEIMNVDGIKEGIYNRIKDFITV